MELCTADAGGIPGHAFPGRTSPRTQTQAGPESNDLALLAEYWNCATGQPCHDATYDRDSDIDALDLAYLGNQYDVEPPELAYVPIATAGVEPA